MITKKSNKPQNISNRLEVDVELDISVIKVLVEEAKTSVPVYVNDVAMLLEDGSYFKALAVLHKLKGLCANMGFEVMQNLVSELENYIIRSPKIDINDLRARVTSIEEAWEAVLSELWIIS